MNSLKLKLGQALKTEDGARTLMVLALGGLLLTAGAMNGGTALTAGPFDTIVTQARDLLSSSYVMFIGMVLLVIGVWQAKSGRGWTVLEGLGAVLVIAFVLPPLFTTVATSVRSAEEVARADARAEVAVARSAFAGGSAPALSGLVAAPSAAR